MRGCFSAGACDELCVLRALLRQACRAFSECPREFAPQVALISAGRANPFGHPAQEVVERLGAIGARVFRTDRDGAAVIETDGRSLTVRSMRGRAWTMRVWRTHA